MRQSSALALACAVFAAAMVQVVAFGTLLQASSLNRAMNQCQQRQPVSVSGAASLSMKRKGKQGGSAADQAAYRAKMANPQGAGGMRAKEDLSLPMFDIYVRTSKEDGTMWYPCGSLGGDERAKASVDAWMGNFFSDFYKGQIERGVATSVLDQKKSLRENVVKAYPSLKKKGSQLQYGFRVRYNGLEEKLGKQEVTPIEESMKAGFLDKLKKQVGL